jgi:CRP/FNR family cyclic AMP-dependent transcriptional regulator
MPEDTKRDRLRLRDHASCSALTDLTMKLVAGDPSFGRRRRYGKGSDIWRVGDPTDRLFLLQRGQVVILLDDPSGHEVIIRVIDAGQLFGECCFCAEHGGTQQNSARAMANCEAVEVEFDRFLNHLQGSTDALTDIVFTLCTRLADAERRIEVLSYRAADDRLVRLLLQAAKTKGTASKQHKGEMTVHLNHEELALMTAMSRSHVSVTMGKLRKLGLIDYGRDTPLRVKVEPLQAFVMKPRASMNRKDR